LKSPQHQANERRQKEHNHRGSKESRLSSKQLKDKIVKGPERDMNLRPDLSSSAFISAYLCSPFSVKEREETPGKDGPSRGARVRQAAVFIYYILIKTTIDNTSICVYNSHEVHAADWLSAGNGGD
jgi:hypothetical protein